MSVLESLFLGLVQGIAEFLPISSSGHLSIFQNLLKIQGDQSGHLLFDVMLHFGTLISIFAVYRRDIMDILRALLRFCRSLGKNGAQYRNTPPTPAGRMAIMIVIATLPLLIIVPFDDYIEQLYYNTTYIGFALIVTGCMLYISDRLPLGSKNERSATVKDSLIVGLAQAFATVPGISRSGMTITTGLLRGFDREYAVRFSFLMSIPAILGATLISIIKAIKYGVSGSLIPVYLIGTAVAAVVGYFAINLVRYLSRKGKFGRFAYYCWAVGIITMILSLIL